MIRQLLFALFVGLSLVVAAHAQGVDAPEPSISAEQVQAAIKKSVAFLYTMQNDKGTWETGATPEEAAQKPGPSVDAVQAKRDFGGHTALAVLALLYAGESPKDPKIQKAIKFLEEAELSGTYASGIRASVWSKLNDHRFKPRLSADAKWLLSAIHKADGTLMGCFSYTSPYPGYDDYSNTQYGVLGLRDAAIRGVEIPTNVWEAIENNMITGQCSNGGWGYHFVDAPTPEKSYGSMTVGCLANLYITQEMLQVKFEGPFNGRDAKDCGHRKPPEAIDKALAWMDRNIPVDFGLKQGGDTQVVLNQGHGVGRYYLYAMERCADACGRKMFGGVNWFQEGAKYLMAHQDPDGGSKANYFGNDIHTDWTTLFLSKGQAPVFYNKLDTKADWNNDPRDIANLSEYIGDELEQRVNWQVIDIRDPVETWLDAPCLFFNGHEFPKFTDEQKKKLRLYTDSGGTLVAEACCSNGAFIRGFRQLTVELWPEWELQNLDRKHPIFEVQHKVVGKVPQIMHMNDGCRSRVFLFLTDASCPWNQNARQSYPGYFQLGMNLARYASDKRTTRSRLFFTPNLFKELAAQGKTAPTASAGEVALTLADWPTDGKRLTDSRGLRHLAETLMTAANVKLEVVTLADQKLDGLDKAQVLHMSGHQSFVVSPENLALVQAFVKRGGIIWTDPQCGRDAFKTSCDAFLKKLAPPAARTRIAPNDALITGKGLPRPGFDAAKIRYKQAVPFAENAPVLDELRIDDRRAVIYSAYDLTCGLDGHDCFNCLGPERNDALKIAVNIILSALPTAPKTP